ncbi:MAG: DegT/DnrJ/EryC1/StrS family aminotransferase [Candidatus Omnitrophica bacterium]|nr:DegT/DnrJ/EryC1/StrS family aminotransferase [Candidatus Omnitrophota bacterium]
MRGERLALYGGKSVRSVPFPERFLIGKEEKEAVNRLFDQAMATGAAIGYGGPEEEAFCQAFARFMGGGYADGVNSGTTALFVALRALDIEPFTEVIVTCLTDPGGMMPIVMNNCIPVIADTEPFSYNTGPAQIEKLITRYTRAIVVAHIAGEPCDMTGIMRIANQHKIPVIEDCAQAHGAKLRGRLVGTFGSLAAFSTMFGKHICTGGQGGIVYTRSQKLAVKARQMADRGKPFNLPPGTSNCVASLNFNLTEFQAAIGRVQVKKLPWIIRRRRSFVRKLRRAFQNFKTVSIPEPLPKSEPSYWFLRLRFHPEFATFCQALVAEGMPVTASYFPMPHLSEWYRARRVFGTSGYPWSCPDYKGKKDWSFPCPNAIAGEKVLFRLSVFESWGESELRDIVKGFKKVEGFFRK